VAHLVALRAEVGAVVVGGGDLDGELLDDLEAVAGDGVDLLGVVGEEAHLADAEVEEDLRAGAVLAEVGGQAELEVGLDGVGALVLEGVGLELVDQADAAALRRM
jgi:hypothetical protein